MRLLKKLVSRGRPQRLRAWLWFDGKQVYVRSIWGLPKKELSSIDCNHQADTKGRHLTCGEMGPKLASHFKA